MDGEAGNRSKSSHSQRGRTTRKHFGKDIEGLDGPRRKTNTTFFVDYTLLPDKT
jgi:hypothetical protein